MKLKYYLGLVLLIIAGVGIYAYSALPDNFHATLMLEKSQFELTLGMMLGGLAAFLIALVLLFFVANWLYSRVATYQSQKDFYKIIAQVLEQASKDNYTPVVYKNPSFLSLSKILRRFTLVPKLSSQNSGISKIDQMFETLNQVELGYAQDLKKYGFASSNDFSVKNILNKITKDYKAGFSVLMDGDFGFGIKKEVFLKMLSKCNQKEIIKMLESSAVLDKVMVFESVEFLKRYQEMPDDKKIAQFAKKANFESMDYVELAKRLKGFFGPDEWLKFFENLTLLDEKAELSFLYILCDLEMINQVVQRFSGVDKSEFLNVRAYIDLRTQGKNYPLDLFFCSDLLCKK